MNDFMIQVIPGDFDVEVLVNRENACLFYGFRQGHAHFVNYYQNYIIQYHIPRFLLAYNLNLFSEMMDSPRVGRLHMTVNADFLLTVNSWEDLIFQLGNQQYHLTQQEAPEFFKELHKEIEISGISKKKMSSFNMKIERGIFKGFSLNSSSKNCFNQIEQKAGVKISCLVTLLSLVITLKGLKRYWMVDTVFENRYYSNNKNLHFSNIKTNFNVQ